MLNSDFLNVVSERGLIHQCTNIDELDKILCNEKSTAYVGFDLTANSLHIGHLLPIMLLRWWKNTGNHPILLMGDATTKIGDPSGRDTTRPILSEDEINSNWVEITKTFDQILGCSTMEFNSKWAKDLKFIDALRDIGRHFSVNKMLTMDSVKNRLDNNQNMSFLEFNYMILQSFDFVELNRRRNCILQMGGSDQWGNITMGIDLARRMNDKEVFGLTSPLLSTSTGKKMGKTADGAVWLSKARMSPADFWQFWRNVDDADVPKFLKMLTELPMSEVKRLSALHGAELNDAKSILATQITELVHGKDSNDTTVTIDKSRLKNGISLIDILVEVGLTTSKGDSRRNIQGRGIKIDNVVIEDLNFVLTKDEPHKISLGKKKSVKIIYK